MRIDSNQSSQALSESSRNAVNEDSVKSASSTATTLSSPVGADQAQLSGFHLQVQALAAQAAQLPDSNTGKIDALRQALARGTYHPDVHAVAGALFNSLVVQPAA